MHPEQKKTLEVCQQEAQIDGWPKIIQTTRCVLNKDMSN